LVTGGLGFIGSHLCRTLLQEDPTLEITVVDNLSSYSTEYGDLEGKVQIVIEDLIKFDYSTADFGQIYHLAGPVGSLGILARNGFLAREILSLTHKVAEIAMATKAELLYVSSSEVYGHDGVHREDSPKIIQEKRGTRMEYALGKLLSEHILINLAVEHDLNFKICRPFNAIGEEQFSENGFVVPTFFQRALAGEDIPLFYGGSQRRSFCHLSDIVAGLVTVQRKGRLGEIYNIGNPNQVVSIRGLAEKIVKLCGSNSQIVEMDPQEVYGKRFIEGPEKIPDISKAQDHTGWAPRLDLDGSLLRILDYYKATRCSRVVK
jgi:nucleoside-diphosphate-sugar epimerase